jgi:GMP synthase-like glutamine amidotransferase
MPRVAVLDCDVYKNFPKELGFQYYGEGTQQWLSDAADGEEWSFTQFHVNAETAEASQLPVVDECDGIVIPGSRFNVTDDLPWIPPLMSVIRDAHSRGKPLFGMCFGHQIIAQALGGTVQHMPPFNFTVDEIALQPAAQRALGAPADKRSLRLYKAHGYQVTEPPPDATVVASSERTPVEMFTVGDRVFCCQGHPEFSKGVMETLLPRVESMMEPAGVEAARRAFDEQPAEGEPLRQLARRLLAGGTVEPPA